MDVFAELLLRPLFWVVLDRPGEEALEEVDQVLPVFLEKVSVEGGFYVVLFY